MGGLKNKVNRLGEKYWQKIFRRLLLRIHKGHVNRKKSKQTTWVKNGQRVWTDTLWLKKKKAKNTQVCTNRLASRKWKLKQWRFSAHQIDRNHSPGNMQRGWREEMGGWWFPISLGDNLACQSIFFQLGDSTSSCHSQRNPNPRAQRHTHKKTHYHMKKSKTSKYPPAEEYATVRLEPGIL